MDYYKLRSVVMNRLSNYLEKVEEMKGKGMEPPPFKDFERKIMTELGVTESMIRTMIEKLVPGGTVKDGKIVRKEG